MELDSKYELLDVVANDSESKTFNARAGAGGRAVLVHVLFGGKAPPGKQKLLDLMLQRLVDAAPEKRSQILEISDYKGMPYAVTEVLPDFHSLREWLEGERQPSPPPSSATTGSAPGTADLFARAGKWTVPPLEARPAPEVKPAPPAPTPAPGPPQKDPGEFTMLFRTAVPAQEPPPAPVPVHTAVPPPPRSAPAPELDEFDRLFQTPAPPVSTPESLTETPGATPPPAQTQEPGEFTRLFRAPVPGAAPVEPIHAQAPPPHLPASEPGQFTRMFQTPSAPAAPGGPPLPQPPLSGDEPGAFTRMFQSPAPPGPPTASAGSGLPAGQAPGEFTQMLRTAAQSGTPYLSPQASGPLQDSQSPAASRGTFTQFFGTTVQPGGQVPVPGAAPGPGRPGQTGATGMFSAADSGQVPAAPSAASGPGDYTRLFSAPPAAPSYDRTPAPQPPVAPAVAPQLQQPQPPVSAPKPSMLPLIILGVALLVVVGALVAYFLLRR